MCSKLAIYEALGHMEGVANAYGNLGKSFVAIMALVAASSLEPGVYFAMNSPVAIIGTTRILSAFAQFEQSLISCLHASKYRIASQQGNSGEYWP